MIPDKFPSRVVYGIEGDHLVLLAEDYAAEAASTIAAWRAVTTYGEAATLVMKPSHVDAPGHAEEASLEEPDAPFDANDDEWWPTFHGTLVARVWDPACTIGTRERTLVMEDWVTFTPDEEGPLLELLAAHGITVRRDDAAVAPLMEP